jgi:predicted aspartyl protease
MVQVQKLTEDMNEVMEELVERMQEFKRRGQWHFSQSEVLEGLFFVDTIVSGLRMEALVDTRETHIFLSEQATKSLHFKPKSCTVTRKVLKSETMSMIGIARWTPLRVGEWFQNMDMLVAPLEYHVMILGL